MGEFFFTFGKTAIISLIIITIFISCVAFLINIFEKTSNKNIKKREHSKSSSIDDKWEMVARNANGDTYYVDIGSIKKRKGLIYYSELGDYVEPIQGFYSSVTKFKVDCGAGKLSDVSTIWYSKPMGNGKGTKEPSAKRVHYPKPDETIYDVMKFVCNYVK